MNSPLRPDGPPVRDGQPYSAIAHLAENVTPFIAMAQALRERGFSAPAILTADREAGLLVIEDLGRRAGGGRRSAGADRGALRGRGRRAGGAARQALPDGLPVEPDLEYAPAALRHGGAADRGRACCSTGILPQARRRAVRRHARAYFALWREALAPGVEAPPTWVLRDFHSPNLLWLPHRARPVARRPSGFPGRRDGASRLRSGLAAAGCPRRRRRHDRDRAAARRYLRRGAPPIRISTARNSSRLYVTLAAQRASKILGIFARLDLRDGKPQYLRHMPRIWGYLQRSLAHPALAPLNDWYAEHVPALQG